jgi:peptide/nickel transport system permease protein
MPAFTLSLVMMAMVIRLTRAGMREVMHSDYIRFARRAASVSGA